MTYNNKELKRDVNGYHVPQVYDAVADEYKVLEGVGGASKVTLCDANGAVIGDLRGKSADRPLATAVAVGTTYWAVDTDPHAASIVVSDGAQWVVI